MVLTTESTSIGERMNPQITKSRKLVKFTEASSGCLINKVQIVPGQLAILPNLPANKFIRLGWAVEYRATKDEMDAIRKSIEEAVSSSTEQETVFLDTPKEEKIESVDDTSGSSEPEDVPVDEGTEPEPEEPEEPEAIPLSPNTVSTKKKKKNR